MKIWVHQEIFQSQTNIFSFINGFNCRVFLFFEILKKLITKANLKFKLNEVEGKLVR